LERDGDADRLRLTDHDRSRRRMAGMEGDAHNEPDNDGEGNPSGQTLPRHKDPTAPNPSRRRDCPGMQKHAPEIEASFSVHLHPRLTDRKG